MRHLSVAPAPDECADEAKKETETERTERTGPGGSHRDDDGKNHKDRSLCKQHDGQHSLVAAWAVEPPRSRCHPSMFADPGHV